MYYTFFLFFFSISFELMSSPHLLFSFVQVKSKIIQQLSAIPVETVARVQQVSNVIASASSVIDEVTVEAQVMLYNYK